MDILKYGMQDEFKRFLRGETIEEKVEGMLRPQNLKIEFQNIDGSWDEEGLIWEENLN